MKSYILKGFLGIFLAVGLFAGSAAHASNMTLAQAQSVINLLLAFNADQSVINSVAISLGLAPQSPAYPSIYPSYPTYPTYPYQQPMYPSYPGCSYGYTGCTYGAPTIDTLSPSSGGVGTSVTLHGNNFTNDNTVHFGQGGAMHVTSSNGGTWLRFTIPQRVGPCSFDGDTSPMRCFVADQLVVPGNYSVYVTNAYGQSNTLTFTVTGWSNSYTNSSLSFSSPAAGSIFYRGDTVPVRWSANVPYGANVVLDLYQSGGTKVGTIAAVNAYTGAYDWHIPSVPNTYFCTMQYPNGLCGLNLQGQYYIVASATANGFDASSGVYGSATSGVFTIR